MRGVYIDDYNLFAAFGDSFRPEFTFLRNNFISKIFCPDPVPLPYKYPSYLVISVLILNIHGLLQNSLQGERHMSNWRFYNVDN